MVSDCSPYSLLVYAHHIPPHPRSPLPTSPSPLPFPLPPCSYTLPASFCGKMVDVMVELQRRRTASRVFLGKHGFITPRDLFRWAERKPSTYQELAECGYMLLGERLRQPSEQAVVREVLHTLLPRVNVEPSTLYARMHAEHRAAAAAATAAVASTSHNGGADAQAAAAAAGATAVLQRGGEEGAVWIPSAVRLYSLAAACMAHDEPVLLVGETGTGKTTVCQLYAEAAGQRLHIINCHQHTETADFLGGLRPARGRAFQIETLGERVGRYEALVASAVAAATGTMEEEATPNTAAPTADAGMDAAVAALEARIEDAAAKVAAAAGAVGASGAQSLLAAVVEEVSALRALAVQCKALFVWEVINEPDEP